MSGFGPQIAPATVFPNFDQGLGRAKKALDFNRENYVLGTLAPTTLFGGPISFIASQANTTVQGIQVFPGRTKISKIAVYFSALTSQALGAASFNIVLGTGAYAQGNVPGNDNSSVPNVSYNSQGEATGSNPTYPAGGGGICTNPATAGQAMFAADVVLNATNFPGIATGTGSGSPLAAIFVPSSPDAVWPEGAVLTLRYTTVALATVTNFVVAAYVEPQPLSASFPASNFPIYATPEPGIDY